MVRVTLGLLKSAGVGRRLVGRRLCLPPSLTMKPMLLYRDLKVLRIIGDTRSSRRDVTWISLEPVRRVEVSTMWKEKDGGGSGRECHA
jgi:hypothetical protein